MTKTIKIFGAALLISLAVASCLAKEQPAIQQQQVPQQPQQSRHSLLASKLMPQQSKSRSARSLSDMFERVKNRIFGKKASSQAASSVASSAIQPAASVNSAQRQPWDLNSFNQQYNPYSALSSGNFQWPTGSSIGNQFISQPYGSLNSFPSSSSSSASGFQSPQSGSASSSMLGLDAISQAASGQSASISQPNGQQIQPSASNGGLFSSASHLIAQYLSPSSPSANQQQQQQLNAAASPAIGQQSSGQQSAGQSMLTPQQQQQQTQYQEFASIIDSMVAQTGASNNQRQPQPNQYAQMQPQQGQQQMQQQGQQQQQQAASYPGAPQSQMMGASQGNSLISGDNDMSASSNVQSYMPATAQQASQKSSMVSLAEQLAPGAQFNKLISFPFSLSPNDDASKEGRYKLHIPFLNQHVKRSDQQASAAANLSAQQKAQQQQQMQQYLSQLYSQQQQPSYSAYGPAQQVAPQQQQQQQQMVAQASQVVPTIVSPSQSSSSSVSAPSQSVSSSVSSAASAPSSSISQAAAPSSNPSVSSSVSSSSSSSSASSSSSSSNMRPSWSVADNQSSVASSSKLIPIQSSAAAPSSSVEVVPQN